MPDITMVQKIKQFRGLTCILLMLTLLALPGNAFAEERECTVTIPTSVEVSGTSAPSDTEFEVVLTSLDTGAPMPEKSNGTVQGPGQIVLGPMTYTVPGDYHYSISQKVGNAANYTYDTSVYSVTVRVVNSEDGGLAAEVWAFKDGGSNKVEEIIFSNEYKAPEEPKAPEGPKKPEDPKKPVVTTAPQTGDMANVNLFIGLLAASALVLVLIGLKARRDARRFE